MALSKNPFFREGPFFISYPGLILPQQQPAAPRGCPDPPSLQTLPVHIHIPYKSYNTFNPPTPPSKSFSLFKELLSLSIRNRYLLTPQHNKTLRTSSHIGRLHNSRSTYRTCYSAHSPMDQSTHVHRTLSYNL